MMNSKYWILKAPQHKVQSLFATYEFMFKELPMIKDYFNWEMLKALPNTTVRSKEEYDQHFNGLRLAMLGNLVEVVKQSLYEYHDNKKHMIDLPTHTDHLVMLIDFLSLLRNALVHARGKLIPIWKNQDKARLQRIKKSLLKKGLCLNIPCQNLPAGILFKENTKNFYKLHIEVKLKKEVKIDEEFLHKMRLVCWHVLTITKKRNRNSLTKYLNHILASK